MNLLQDPNVIYAGKIVLGIGGLVTGGAGAIFAFLSWKGKKKKMTYCVREFPVLSVANELSDDIEVRYRGNTILNLKLIEITIRNAGSVAIETKDFDRPLKLQFNDAIQILSEEILQKIPKNLPVSYSFQSNIISIDPLLLNQGDLIKYKILASNYEYFNIEARINGIKDIKNADDINYHKNSILNRLKFIGIFSLLLCGIYFFPVNNYIQLQLNSLPLISFARTISIYPIAILLVGLISNTLIDLFKDVKMTWDDKK